MECALKYIKEFECYLFFDFNLSLISSPFLLRFIIVFPGSLNFIEFSNEMLVIFLMH